MTERQLMLIQDLRPEVISCTPSYAQTLAEEFRKRGVSPEEISLKYAVLGAKPWTEAIRKQVDEGLGVRSTNIYGLSEIIGPGVANECVEERRGATSGRTTSSPRWWTPIPGNPFPRARWGS